MLRAFLLPLRLFFAVSLLALLMGGAQAQDVQPLPPLAAHVTDTVGLLSVDRREAIEARLVALEREKGAQVAVLLVATTRPEAIEEYALRVAEAGRLGRKGVDDGVLFVVARDDRRMRIEVGRGLEGAIPDAIAARLTEAKQTIPHFYLRRAARIDDLLAFRSELNKKLEGRGVKLSVNDFIIKACALALQAVPDANAVWVPCQLAPGEDAAAARAALTRWVDLA